MSDVTIIEDPTHASMLSNPIKLAILDLLSKKEMTISEISRKLKTNKAKISYHIKSLHQAGLVYILREEERRGMHFKYFRAAYKVLILNIRSRIKEEYKMAFLSPIKTFIDGYLAGAGAYHDPEKREFFKSRIPRLLELVAEEILVITSNFPSEKAKSNDGDEIRSLIYAEAVEKVLEKDEFAF